MRVALSLLVAGLVAYKTGADALAALAGLVTYLAVCWPDVARELARYRRRRAWWSHENLVRTLTTAGVLSKLKPDERPHVLHYRGRPQHDELGTAVQIKLPPGVDFATVAGKHSKLAAALDVPANRLHVTKRPDDPESVARIWVGHGNALPDHRRSPLAGVDRTRWSDPVELGLDRGTVVELATFEHNTLLGGEPGSGKTTAGRLIIGHYLLDPAALIYGLDGKGSRKDYRRVADLAERWVWGNSETAADDTLAMLRELLDIVRDRNAHDTDDNEPPAAGVLLILEEFQDIRQSASKEVRADIDGVLGQIIRMARAIGFHILISTQRPSVDDIPSGQRNLVNQRVALKLPDAADYKLVLGHTAKITPPTRRGDALVAAGGPDRTVVIDYLNGTDWRDLCDRARELRRPATRELVEPPTIEQAQPAAPTDPLELAVVDVLTRSPGGLSPTDLHRALPAAPWRPAAVPVLGKRLATMESVELVKTRERRYWRLKYPAGVEPANSAVADGTVTAGTGHGDGTVTA